jgi:peroxiredoxin Q/BCP
MLKEGTRAPDFTLKNQHGEDVTLGDFSGRWIAMFWYPKAATPG